MADRDIIARRYAQAILNYCDLSYADVCMCYAIGTYFMQHSVSAFFLRLSSIDGYDKIRVMTNTIREQFAPDDSVMNVIQRLLQLLDTGNRFSLFMQVCIMLRNEYYERHAIEPCTVYMSHEMETSEISPIVSWLEQQVHKTLEPEYRINSSLIAGVRVCGKTFVWEDSIARNIRHMKHNVYAQWGIA